MPTLRELEARLLRWYRETTTERDAEGKYVFRDDGEITMWSPHPYRDLFAPVENLHDAHGISFLCPKSFAKNGGPKGTHSVYVWFAGSPVPPEIGHNKDGAPVRWNASGTSIDNLVLTPSILEQGDELPADHRCGWHGFVGSSGVPPGCAA